MHQIFLSRLSAFRFNINNRTAETSSYGRRLINKSSDSFVFGRILFNEQMFKNIFGKVADQGPLTDKIMLTSYFLHIFDSVINVETEVITAL